MFAVLQISSWKDESCLAKVNLVLLAACVAGCKVKSMSSEIDIISSIKIIIRILREGRPNFFRCGEEEGARKERVKINLIEKKDTRSGGKQHLGPGQTIKHFLVKHFRCALQAMFDRLATSQKQLASKLRQQCRCKKCFRQTMFCGITKRPNIVF